MIWTTDRYINLFTNFRFKNERLGKNAGERKAIYDLYCTNNKGEKFIVEIQRAKQEFFKDRTLYYATFPIQEQAEIATMNRKERTFYEESLKDYRDLKSSMDTYFDDGKKIGREEERKELIINAYNQGVPLDTIAKFSNTPIEEVRKIINSIE